MARSTGKGRGDAVCKVRMPPEIRPDGFSLVDKAQGDLARLRPVPAFQRILA